MELLKFEADWCGPCKQQSKLLEEYDATPVSVINVDGSEKEQAKAVEYQVQTIPTLVLEENGEEVARWTGVTQIDEIEAEL